MARRADGDPSARGGQRLCKDQQGVLCLPALKMLSMQVTLNERQSLRDGATVPQASVSESARSTSLSASVAAVLQGGSSRGLPHLSQCWLCAGGWHPGVPFACPSLYCADADFSVVKAGDVVT